MTVEMISHLLEALMILCFGLSWPLSIYKSWTSRTAKERAFTLRCSSGSDIFSVLPTNLSAI